MKFALCGNLPLLSKMVEKLYKKDNYGFNELHYLVLTKSKPSDIPDGVRAQSIHKKGSYCANATPLHFACINPCTAILALLLEKGGDINMMDFN